MTARRLGRGLSALIQESPSGIPSSDSILLIPIHLISPNPFQPRQDFESSQALKSIKELADSIREKGIIQPIAVRSRNGRYELIVGERRWRAARVAGLKEIKAHVLDLTDDVEMMEYSLIENIQRENLNVIEEAEAYAALSETYSLSHTEIGKAVGKSRTAITNTLRLLKLPARIKESLRKEEITAGHARALLGLESPEDMLKLWRRIVERQESVRATEELVAHVGAKPFRQPKKKSVRVRKSADIRKIEDDLITILGTKVLLHPKGRGGVIEVEYYSHEDLERLLELFNEIES